MYLTDGGSALTEGYKLYQSEVDRHRDLLKRLINRQREWLKLMGAVTAASLLLFGVAVWVMCHPVACEVPFGN